MKPLIYSFSVWITSILLGPLFYYPLQLIMEPQYPHRFTYSFTLYALIFSLPSFVLFMLIVLLVRVIPTNQLIKKLILSVAGVVLTAAPLYLIDGGLQTLAYFIAYGSITVIGIWVFRLNAPNMDE